MYFNIKINHSLLTDIEQTVIDNFDLAVAQ